VIDFIAENISTETYLNIMDQYYLAYNSSQHRKLNRRITKDEFNEVTKYAKSKGFKIYE